MLRTAFAMLAMLSCSVAIADDAIYGNESGCGPIESANDSRIRLSPTAIEFWETTCTLPAEPDFSGAPMTVTCRGEGEEWTDTISLKREGDVIRYESEGRTEELRPCSN